MTGWCARIARDGRGGKPPSRAVSRGLAPYNYGAAD